MACYFNECLLENWKRSASSEPLKILQPFNDYKTHKEKLIIQALHLRAQVGHAIFNYKSNDPLLDPLEIYGRMGHLVPLPF